MIRAQALAATRTFFESRGFLEVETPMLVPGPGLEPAIDPLAVPLRFAPDAAPVTRYLHTSPEFALKRVVAAGLPRVFQVARVFRDGERTRTHLPEFTLLEWYRAESSLDSLIDDCAALMHVVRKACGADSPQAPMPQPTTLSALFSTLGYDLPALLDQRADGDASAFARAARANGEPVRADTPFDDVFFHLMTARIEPTLIAGGPWVVSGWPRHMAVLARLDEDPRFARRFELYAGGLELANAFDELRDADEQRRRFEEDNEQRRKEGKIALPLDEDFLAALPSLPATAGIALGFDRLLMWATDAAHIDDVQVLPFR